jgi:hypothetical protein
MNTSIWKLCPRLLPVPVLRITGFDDAGRASPPASILNSRRMLKTASAFRFRRSPLLPAHRIHTQIRRSTLAVSFPSWLHTASVRASQRRHRAVVPCTHSFSARRPASKTTLWRVNARFVARHTPLTSVECSARYTPRYQRPELHTLQVQASSGRSATCVLCPLQVQAHGVRFDRQFVYCDIVHDQRGDRESSPDWRTSRHVLIGL